MKILAVIPARGGSKGIPKKNLQTVCGQSLIAHALKCVAGSRYNMDVVLSTDCPEILEHARSLGYEGEYFRPKNLGQDDSRIVDAVLDVLSWARKHKDLNYQVVILLQPTSPLRLSSDLDSLDLYAFRREKCFVCYFGQRNERSPSRVPHRRFGTLGVSN